MEDYIRIIDLKNEVEARLLETELASRNIPFIMKSHYDIAYDGIFQAHQGWGFVQAPPAHKEEILSIYNDIADNNN